MANVAHAPPESTSAPRATRLLWPKKKRLSQGGCGCSAAASHRRRLVAAAALTGTGLLGASLSTEPDSTEFYALTFAVAGTWLVGGLASGPLPFHSDRTDGHPIVRDVVIPILAGATAFGAFFGAALVARRIPLLNEALTSVLSYADRGSDPLVLATTLANGIAEEVFFRGGLFSTLEAHNPVPLSTAVYMLTTSATRNPALVLASGVMGSLFALQRRSSGGIQAPILTHVTWSALMLRYIPSVILDRN